MKIERTHTAKGHYKPVADVNRQMRINSVNGGRACIDFYIKGERHVLTLTRDEIDVLNIRVRSNHLKEQG